MSLYYIFISLRISYSNELLLRNFIFAPITEEICFRSLMLYCLLRYQSFESNHMIEISSNKCNIYIYIYIYINIYIYIYIYTYIYKNV